jgi:alkylation response protein AidB-like acyl-CoA dehydrogenase
MISATKVTGPSNSASASHHSARTSYGRWWRRDDETKAFSSEVGTGSREENASNQKIRARLQFNQTECTLKGSGTRTVMTVALRFDPIRLPPECEKLRQEVRAFLAEEIAAGTFDPHRPQTEDTDVPAFSRRVGERGWIGMTWPKKYGGHERSFLERYVVTEEMRVANAPTRRFFVADRQSGPVLLKYAPEHIKMDILPRICRGEVCFSIGMSEPNSGSDLFAAKTKATKTDGGWLINGTKIWTTSAHIADYMLGIFRTSPSIQDNRRHGLTQFLVDMKTPGITVNPIGQMSGLREFNEVVFQDAFMPDDHVLGEIDGAWKQATSELAYERSGPERFLETYYVLTELVRALGKQPDARGAEGIGRLVAQLHTMRRMSVSVAGMLQAGKEPVVEASIVKDIGTIWEQQLPHRVRNLAAFVEPDVSNHETLDRQLDFAIKVAPKLTIQGGTTEVLRGIIARGLGLR